MKLNLKFASLIILIPLDGMMNQTAKLYMFHKETTYTSERTSDATLSFTTHSTGSRKQVKILVSNSPETPYSTYEEEKETSESDKCTT